MRPDGSTTCSSHRQRLVPQPRYADLRRFCEIDAWEELTGASGRTGDHRRYRKILPNGAILRTKVSHGSGLIEDPDLWHRIWRDQLGLESEHQFWDALRARRPVPRGEAEPEPPTGPSIPAWAVAGLLREGVAEEEIRGLSSDDAQRRLGRIWSSRRRDA